MNDDENTEEKTNVKSQLIDEILLKMNPYINSTTSDILKKILEDSFLYINMERMNTLPQSMRNDIDARNKYFMNLMIIKKKNLRDNTKSNYLLTISRFSNFIDKPLDQIDEIDIDAYLRYYEQRVDPKTKRSPNAITCNIERSYLSAFFSWMKKEKFITYNPVDNVERRKTVQKPIDYFNQQQMEQLREGCKNLRDLALVEFLRSTGARVGEVVSINKDNINWATGDILILSEKSDKYRTLYLDEVSRYHLKKYLDSRDDDCDALFVRIIKPYKRMTRSGIEYSLKVIANRGGVKGRVYPHKMRKTLGMNLRNRGVDLGTIQEILGHANPDTTARYYAESTPETLRDVRKKVGS